jgi:hypothetical protein
MFLCMRIKTISGIVYSNRFIIVRQCFSPKVQVVLRQIVAKKSDLITNQISLVGGVCN